MGSAEGRLCAGRARRIVRAYKPFQLESVADFPDGEGSREGRQPKKL